MVMFNQFATSIVDAVGYRAVKQYGIWTVEN